MNERIGSDECIRASVLVNKWAQRVMYTLQTNIHSGVTSVETSKRWTVLDERLDEALSALQEADDIVRDLEEL